MLKVGFWGLPFSETSALTQVKAKVFAGWGLGNDENPWDEDLEIIGYQATIQLVRPLRELSWCVYKSNFTNWVMVFRTN